MKSIKYFVLSLLGLLSVGFMSSCDDDPTDGDAPRLFRPVASLETSNNTIIATWDNIAGANRYNLTLLKVTGTNEAGENIYTVHSTATCESSPYTFTDLEWDEKYKVQISCAGDVKSSDDYETNDVNISYPTTLKNVKTIDNAARVTWDNGVTATEEGSDPVIDESVTVIKAIVAKPVDGEGATVVKLINSSTFLAGETDIMGLDPQTRYYFVAYTTNDEAEFNNSTYAGRLSASTSKAIDFDSEYGAGTWLDIRDYDEKQAVDTLKTEGFWNNLEEGITTIILRGDFDYKVNNSIKFDRSVRFVTASTLGSNARFISSGGLTMASGVEVDFVEFVNVDFISDKVKNGDNPVATNTDKGWGGRQVFNVNGTKSTLKKLSFKGCNIQGYRAFVRAQANTDNILEIDVEDCVIDCIGDQGVFTTTNKAADWRTINLKNSTITNIVMLCDLRLTAQELTFNIENCTFCYAPIETNANANTPLFRLSGNNNIVKLNIIGTLFGPAMATDKGAGDNIHAYQASTDKANIGSIFLTANDGTEKPAPLVNVSRSFKTDFIWEFNIADKIASYPIEALQELGMDENALWSDPSKGVFRIHANLPEDGLGDPRWN